MTVFHRGAAVSQPLFFKGAKLVWDIVPPRNYRRFIYIEPNGLTSDQMAAVSNPARQRRKGPITRYGVKQ